ncbi:MAG TPA: hypothetical protein VF978_07485 [Gemmatimonadales bacterium]
MLNDRYLPTIDATSICESSVNAAPDVAYGARALRGIKAHAAWGRT